MTMSICMSPCDVDATDQDGESVLASRAADPVDRNFRRESIADLINIEIYECKNISFCQDLKLSEVKITSSFCLTPCGFKSARHSPAGKSDYVVFPVCVVQNLPLSFFHSD